MIEVRECRRRDLESWLLNVHYARRLPSVSFGFLLYIDGVNCGAMTVGKPASPWIGRGVCGGKHEESVYELNRLVLSEGLPKNTASQFVGSCLSILAQKRDFIIVSYADTEWGHCGYVYQATNFIYTGASKPRTDVDPGPGKHSRHYEMTDEARSVRKFRSAKHRYVIFVGPGRKKMRRDLAYPVFPYPKGKNSRSDTNLPKPRKRTKGVGGR